MGNFLILTLTFVKNDKVKQKLILSKGEIYSTIFGVKGEFR